MTVQEEVRQRIERDPLLAKLRQKIESGKASYTDTAAYSIRAGKLLGEIFSRRLPEIPPEEREQLCVDLLHDRYIDINAAVDAVQRFMDEAQGLHLAPQHAPFDAERGHQIGSSLRDLSKPVETLQRRARAAAETATKSMHDDRMKAEARFRSRAGLQCYITRKAVNGCCPWCTAVAGRYAYGEEPDGIYRRHDNCDCTVTFENGRKRQDVWSKREWEVSEPGVGAGEPVRLTAEQARELEAEHLPVVLTDRKNPAIIKSIDVDDYTTVTYGKGISKEVSDVIIDTLRKCEKNGGFIISEISTTVTHTSIHGTPVLQIEPLPNGLLQLNINADFLSGKTVAEIDERFKSTESTVVDSLAEAVIHESGHAIAISGKTVQKIEQLYQQLKAAGLPGVSDIALADGAECLAELEVLRTRGTKVSQELAAFYRKYMGRKYS